MMVFSQSLAAFAIFGLAYAETAPMIGMLLCLAGAASAALSMNLYAIAQMFAGPRASGTWVGVQNSIGNSSGIFGPLVTAYVIDQAGWANAFLLTAGIAAIGALWWAFGVPKIQPLALD
jgi:MFS family permease